VNVAPLDASFGKADVALERRGEGKADGALHLCLHQARVDRDAAVHRGIDPVNAQPPRAAYRDFHHLR
jgi:hypothetical protein